MLDKLDKFILERFIYLSLSGIIIYLIDIKMLQRNLHKQRKKLLHSPNLNTIIMVENILKKGELMTLAQLKKSLPKQIMHQTLLQILDYLQLSGKIVIGTKGILWIFTERKELNGLMQIGTEV